MTCDTFSQRFFSRARATLAFRVSCRGSAAGLVKIRINRRFEETPNALSLTTIIIKRIPRTNLRCNDERGTSTTGTDATTHDRRQDSKQRLDLKRLYIEGARAPEDCTRMVADSATLRSDHAEEDCTFIKTLRRSALTPPRGCASRDPHPPARAAAWRQSRVHYARAPAGALAPSEPW